MPTVGGKKYSYTKAGKKAAKKAKKSAKKAGKKTAYFGMKGRRGQA